jgi:hypothetical protein
MQLKVWKRLLESEAREKILLRGRETRCHIWQSISASKSKCRFAPPTPRKNRWAAATTKNLNLPNAVCILFSMNTVIA